VSEKPYDVMIVGAGPAGSTSALYAQRFGLNTVVFGDIPGGNMYMIEKLMNFPGFPGGVPGTQFGAAAFQQAQAEGALFTLTRVAEVGFARGLFKASDVDGKEYFSKTAIVSTGRVPKRLPFSNSNIRGIHFCSICDGPIYRGKEADLAVVGSDNAAAQHALSLSRFAKRVFLIFRSESPIMDAVHRKLLARQENVEILPGTELLDVKGAEVIEALVAVTKGAEKKEIGVDGLFVAIGWEPNTEMLLMEVEKDHEGYILTDARLMTSFPGLFAAGDVRDTDLRQVLTACADGARAAGHAAELL
jgi:thioredoxin reductase (NADPH)